MPSRRGLFRTDFLDWILYAPSERISEYVKVRNNAELIIKLLNQHCECNRALSRGPCILIMFWFDFGIFLLLDKMEVVLCTTLVSNLLGFDLDRGMLREQDYIQYSYETETFIQLLGASAMTPRMSDGSKRRIGGNESRKIHTEEYADRGLPCSS